MNLLGTWHIFSTGGMSYRWMRPEHYKAPGYRYQSQLTYRHRDKAGRVRDKLPYEDRYIHHYDGKLRKLIVACTDEIFVNQSTSTWRRTYVRKVSPLTVRLATWVIDFTYDPASWEDWWVMLLRAFPAAMAMQCVFWHGEPERVQFQGNYAPVWYSYWGDAKVWSNHLEDGHDTSKMARNNEIYRALKPRDLCFLRNPYDDELHGIDVRPVTDWEQSDGIGANLSYLFIAYSTAHFSHDSQEDLNALHLIAETAARAANAPAYWVACSCMRDPEQLEADGMIIAVGQSKGKAAISHETTDTLLAQWGTRMWTFPEVLLSPGQSIPVYTRGSNLRNPLIVSKNQFAGRVWGELDGTRSRQLTDHCLGNLGMSHLELAVTALKCLYDRDTTEHLPGDQAYALMGLLRMRPQIDQTDTPFQAFARLSLANDSDKLLERYMCTLPKSPSQPWYHMEDQYNSQLWDIEPYVQVAAICDHDTIILDGARGASIRWKSFFRPAAWTGPSWKRTFAIQIMNNQMIVLILALVFFVFGSVFIVLGIIFLLLYLAVFLYTPQLIRTIYGGKFVDVQAALFGFEGYLNAATVERALFGGSFGRFSWSENGSPLSRSFVNEHNEKVGMDPTKDVNVRAKVEAAKFARPGDMRVFTLVDTYNMQLTLFEAVRAPTVLFLCASEGGMQRAIGCSHDWTTSTMYRETVLRLPTESLNRMDRVPRVKIGIQRPEMPSSPVDGGAVAV
ncbi:hypothetical protein QBC46DRAFT_419300 [Diplogelasinospora grovesii]|uniref:Uncharacterized protein n=1 Tax=Diplogelasinospora grovesii TaxID=303347 RepID=A0AAN6S0Y1_9PEZI|nr:hypothetical protein QBC46DRAFT_419300 [Diplogelasinospora grovesii]